jgi:uncharacterized membrane protein
MRWLLFLISAGCLLKTIFFTATPWSVGGFFLCGLAWYWLTWRHTRHLDSPKPR